MTPPPADKLFRTQAVTAAHWACDEFFRRRYPQRHLLKNRLRLVVHESAQYTMWIDASGATACGWFRWKGRPAVEFSGCHLVMTPSESLESAVVAILEDAAGPVELDNLAGYVAAAWGMRDIRLDTAEMADAAFSNHVTLERFWAALADLPSPQPSLLLFHMRDDRGGSILPLLPAYGVAGLSRIAEALEIPVEELLELWNRLPLSDAEIGLRLGLTRWQVIASRSHARQSLHPAGEYSRQQADLPRDSQTDHLTSPQVDAYWTRKLNPDDLLALDAHIAACSPCREALVAAAPPFLFTPELQPDAHLEYTQIASSELSSSGQIHLTRCVSCRAEYEDFQRFRAQYQRQAKHSRPAAVPPWFRTRWMLALPAACLTLFILFLAARPKALLDDSGQQIALDRRGNLTGLPNLPPDISSMLAAIAAGGDLPVAARPVELPEGNISGQTGEFAVTDPRGRVVFDDRPVFIWTPLEGATSYRVEILDENGRPAEQSRRIFECQWRPDASLARRHAYSWRVTALRAGTELSAPEARFAVLDEERADRLAAALARSPVSHFALVALYAEAGMNRESLQELEILRAGNPRSVLLDRLRAQLERAR